MEKNTLLAKLLDRLFAPLQFLKSRIPKEIALEHIRYYRQGLDPSSIKSAWIDREFIEYVISNDPDKNITGLRVYLAKYKEGFEPVIDHPALKDLHTVIVVPTVSGVTGGHPDIQDAYFNYGRPCPPTCDDDGGEG